jgi:AcrR family transcriptional regulator
MSETRERILEVAMDLFISQGYDKVSLREIAEPLGITKAALYYHFSSKEDIVKTLVQPMYDAVSQAGEAMDELRDRGAWARNIPPIIDWILEHRRLVELIQVNHAALGSMVQDWIDSELHRSLHTRFDEFMTDESLSVEDRVRVAAALGVLAGVFSFPGGSLRTDIDPQVLRPLMVQMVGDVLGVEVGSSALVERTA